MKHSDFAENNDFFLSRLPFQWGIFPSWKIISTCENSINCPLYSFLGIGIIKIIEVWWWSSVFKSVALVSSAIITVESVDKLQLKDNYMLTGMRTNTIEKHIESSCKTNDHFRFSSFQVKTRQRCSTATTVTASWWRSSTGCCSGRL